MDADELAALERSLDPLYDRRAVMPASEFDGVDFFVNEPRRPPAPEPSVVAYFDAYPMLDVIEKLPEMADGMARTLNGRIRPLSLAFDGVERGTALEPFGPAAVAELHDAVVVGHGHSFGLSVETPDNEDFWFLDGWLLPDRTEAALSLSLTPSPDFLDPSAAEAVLDLLLSWVDLIGLRTGGIAYDRTGASRSPWDAWYGVDYRTTALLTADHVRGYYWANILTAGHLARLGGVEALRLSASAHRLLLSELSDEAVVLRAPGPITAFDDTLLAAMKEVLEPVLMPTPYVLYEGYPLRIIPDPGTAFRRVPPGDPRPRLHPRA